jgi:hypothetical protein
MLKRRFLLRLAIAVAAFIIGLTAASLFGAGRRASFFAPRAQARFYYVPYDATPRDLESSPPCGSYRTRHAFERHEWRERAFDFDAPPPPPPAPPQQGYFGR